MTACLAFAAAAAAAAPFRHAPLPRELRELRGSFRPALLDQLSGLRSAANDCRSWLVQNTYSMIAADTALHAATVHTISGVEVFCGSMRRVAQAKPTGQVVCAIVAGAFCSALSLLSLGLCTICTLGETAARLAKLAAGAAAEGTAYAATLGGDLGTSRLGLDRVDPTLALPLLPKTAPEEVEAPSVDGGAVPQGGDAG